MARRVIKTMAAKMAESGKEAGKDVLDDSDLASDPIINALQTLRSQIDDFQHNDNDLDITNLKSAINANTNRGSGSDGAKGDTGNTGARGPAGNNGSNGLNGARGPAGATGSLAITSGCNASLQVTVSRGVATLTITVTGGDLFEGKKTVGLRLS